ncbi:MAG: GtrA family protein [Christensenellaceae bacterium]|nr:GtrA family protein [Christensenellaceae bacterium]
MLKKESVLQFIKFNLVGVLNTLVDFCIYQLLLLLGVHYLAAQCISYACGVLNSFFFNSRWTFEQDKPYTKKKFLSFCAVNLVSLGLSLLLLHICYEIIGLNSNLIIKGAVTVVVMVINFIGNKLFVFK